MNEQNRLPARIRAILLVLLPALVLALLLYSVLSGLIPARHDSGDSFDRTPPSIALTRDNRYYVFPGEQYEEEGYAAYDNVDGDLTKQVEVAVNGDFVRYRVKDSAGNIAVRFRRIPYRSAKDQDDENQQP